MNRLRSNSLMPKYSIAINQSICDQSNGCLFEIAYGKNYGDREGGSTHITTTDDVLAYLQRVGENWRGEDHSLHRQNDPITATSFSFESHLPEWTKERVLRILTSKDELPLKEHAETPPIQPEEELQEVHK